MSADPKRIRIAADNHLRFRRGIADDRQLCFALLLLLGLYVPVAGCHRGVKQDAVPKISFTQVPQWDTGDRNEHDVMEGTVSGSRQGQRMVLYSKCGGLWWLQPL